MRLLFLFLLIPILSISQEKFEFSAVVQQEGTVDELDQRAYDWLAANFGAYESGPYANGELNLKRTFHIHSGSVTFTVTLKIKEGRYKYNFTNFMHYSSEYSGGRLNNEKPDCGWLLMTRKGWKQIKEQATNHVDELVKSLKTAMSTADDW